MAYDERLAATLREGLAGQSGITERKMFGGLCFLIRGNMVCGTYRDRGMYRVGKERASEALALPYVRPMTMTGRPMPGMIEADAEAIADPELRRRLLGLAIASAGSLPAK